MRKHTAMVSAAAVMFLAAGVLAQQPNFAGKWTMDAPAAGAAAPAPGGGGGGRGGRGGGGGWGMEATITQTPTTLTVAYTQGQNPVTLTYNLNGSESKNTMPGRGGAAGAEQVSTASWDGARLKIVTKTQFGEQTRFVSLDGGKLKIETSTVGPDGTAMPATTVTYTKAP